MKTERSLKPRYQIVTCFFQRIGFKIVGVICISNCDISDKVLTDFITRRNKDLKDLKGKITFRDDYDYKSLRN